MIFFLLHFKKIIKENPHETLALTDFEKTAQVTLQSMVKQYSVKIHAHVDCLGLV